MRELVQASVRNPAVVETAVGVVRHIGGRDSVSLQRALREWLAVHVSFLPDPMVDGEVLRTPDYAIREINKYGVARLDCDDVSMLAAALAKSVGLPARFVVLGFPEYRHVYAESLTVNGWLDFDVTETSARQAMFRPMAHRTIHWQV